MGKNELTLGIDRFRQYPYQRSQPDANFWDIAVFYTADWNSIKLSAAAAYTWQEAAVNSGGIHHGILQRPRQPRQHWLLLGS